MTKFISIHENIINIESISHAEFISDDIFLGDFLPDEKGNPKIDYFSFNFAKVKLTSGEVIEMNVELYYPEESETEEEWYEENRNLINAAWFKLINAIGSITQIIK